ncbi:MAG: WD40 repeat domain-containing protein [Armatimonadetes bacterium]|nr:WD40 repeat domain-containing protein [Armatimonadota bacterium]
MVWTFVVLLAGAPPELVPPSSHLGGITSLALAPDGKLAATTGRDGDLRLWDLANGANRPVRAQAAESTTVAFDPGGRLVACGGPNGTVRVWDPETGSLLRTLEPPRPEGRTGPPGDIGATHAVAVSADGQRVAAAVGGQVFVWDRGSGQVVATCGPHPQVRIQALAFSPDGKRLASGCGVGAGPSGLRMWDAATGRLVRQLGDERDYVDGLAFSPDGATLAASGPLGTVIVLWDTATWSERGRLEGHTRNQTVRSLAYSPDGARLASTAGGSRDELFLWDVATLKPVARLVEPGVAGPLAFLPGGLTVAVGSGSILLWQPADGGAVRRLDPPKLGSAALAFSPDGTALITAGDDGAVRAWDLRAAVVRVLARFPERVADLRLSPDGRVLACASGGGPGVVRLVEPATGQVLRTIAVQERGVGSVAFSGDGTRLLASGDLVARLFDTAAGAKLLELPGHPSTVMAVALSPDGRLAATASLRRDGMFYRGDVRLYETETGALLRTIDAHTDRAAALSFAPDGMLLASGGGDGQVKLWGPADGALRGELTGAHGSFLSLAFAPDGAWLAAASAGSPGQGPFGVHLWDLPGGKPRGVLPGPPAGSRAVAVSPDGKAIAAAGRDGVTRLWDAVTGDLRASLVAYEPGEWLVATADGRWHGSEPAAKAVTWRIGDSLYPCAGYAQLHDPDAVAKALRGEPLPASELAQRFLAGELRP